MIEHTVSLIDFCKDHTQIEAARILKKTQGAVFQMLRDKRQIYITRHLDGTYSAYEIKRFATEEKKACQQ